MNDFPEPQFIVRTVLRCGMDEEEHESPLFVLSSKGAVDLARELLNIAKESQDSERGS